MQCHKDEYIQIDNNNSLMVHFELIIKKKTVTAKPLSTAHIMLQSQ